MGVIGNPTAPSSSGGRRLKATSKRIPTTRLEGQLLTTRERILSHQEQPQCASCHRKVDQIGFGLENFNAVGRPYSFSDDALAASVVQRASQKDFALREFIHAIVQSKEFQAK